MRFGCELLGRGDEKRNGDNWGGNGLWHILLAHQELALHYITLRSKCHQAGLRGLAMPLPTTTLKAQHSDIWAEYKSVLLRQFVADL